MFRIGVSVGGQALSSNMHSVAYALFHPTGPRFSRTYQRTRRDEDGVVAHRD